MNHLGRCEVEQPQEAILGPVNPKRSGLTIHLKNWQFEEERSIRTTSRTRVASANNFRNRGREEARRPHDLFIWCGVDSGRGTASTAKALLLREDW